jgi:hypothetical protein
VEKISGQVAYAVLQFGGFLGIGSDYYPIPWDSLKYDTSLGDTASTSLRSSSEVHRSTRAQIGTGKIVRVAARSTIITARRGGNTERAWQGWRPGGRRPCQRRRQRRQPGRHARVSSCFCSPGVIGRLSAGATLGDRALPLHLSLERLLVPRAAHCHSPETVWPSAAGLTGLDTGTAARQGRLRPSPH